MQKNKSKGSVVGILLPMGLICLFALCSLALALLGGQAYRQIQDGVDDAFDSTVAVGYLRNKLTQNNEAGKVSLRREGVFDVLVIKEKHGEDSYETRIYVIDGELRETFVPASVPFEGASGITIATMGECEFEVSPDGVFTAYIVSPEGVSSRISFALAGGGGTS